jgi:hypothetical protein
MLASDRIGETRFSLSPTVPAAEHDRRRDERQLTILRVGLLVIGGARELCLIRNISAGGMMAHIYRAATPGETVTVELKSGQAIGGRVVWADASNVGIAFDALIDVAELLATPPSGCKGWRPRLPRVEVDRLATLRVGADTLWANVRDISQGGVKVEVDRLLEPGTALVVTPEHLRPLPASVRWCKDGLCGVAFHQLLPFEELMAWLKR